MQHSVITGKILNQVVRDLSGKMVLKWGWSDEDNYGEWVTISEAYTKNQLRV